MCNIFIRFPFPCAYKLVDCEQNGIDSLQLHNIISKTIGFGDFSLYCNGKKVPAGQHVLPHSTIHVSFCLPGGKGGFGSMLRAIGAQIEKTTNREACRDLSGRRLRDINEEQRLKNWIAKKSEREAEKMRRRKERLERLKSRPKHNFVDFGYEKKISELPERIDDALTAGMEKIKKRPSEISEPSTSGQNKKKRLWLDEDISESSESDSDLSSLKSNEECDEELQKRNNTDELLRNVCRSESNEEISCSENGSQQEINTTQQELNSASNGSQLEINATQLELNSDLNGSQLEMNVAKLELKSNSIGSQPELKDNSSKSDEVVDLNGYKDVKELEALGLERLKSALMLRGLKCGGNLTDRASRLWAIRGLNPNQYPKNLLAKQKK